jgi:CRP-like cAMP-binding protein
VQIYQQREERANLRRLTDGSQLGEPLTGAEGAAIQGLWRTAQHHPANSNIETGKTIRLITSGWAGWVRFAPDGRRLIFLFLMPGDYIVPSLFNVFNCDLVSLTTLRTVDASALGETSTTTPQSGATIQQSARRYRHLMLDHMTRLMMGSTVKSVASLLTEFHDRSLRSGACADGRFSLPIGQRVMASSLGRSTVQINKVMTSFQTSGLIRVGYNWLEVVEPQKLHSMCGLAPPRPSPKCATLSDRRPLASL